MKYLRAVVFCLATLLLYLGLPLLGWGLDRLNEFFLNPSRTAYAVVVLLFGVAVGIQAIDAPEGIRGSKGEEDKRVHRQSLVRIGLILFLYATLIFLPFADRHSIAVWDEMAALRWLGAILAGIGFALIFLSGLALGRQYSQEVTIQKDHQLITGGIFHAIRNPRYLGVMAAAIGLSCLFRTWAGLVISAIVIVVLLLRIKDEEALMHKEFGSEWEAYCKKSWHLIPYLY